MSMPRHQPPAHSPIPGRALWRVLRSIGTPEEGAAALRDLLARAYAADRVLLYGSGTQALTAAIRLHLDARRGRVAASDAAHAAVALPAYACFDVASAAVGAGVAVTLYDLDPDTLGPDLDSLLRALRDGAGVVVLASLYGMPVDAPAIAALAARHGATVIEDAAQSHGSLLGDARPGSFTESAVLSFGRGKGWTGSAGGALLLRGALARDRDGGVADEARHAHDAGPPLDRSVARAGGLLVRAAAQALLSRPDVYGLPASFPWLHLGETRYHPPREPAGMNGLAATLALATEAASSAEAAVRRRHGEELRDRLERASGCRTIRRVPSAVPGYLRFPLRLSPDVAIEVRARGARLGIGAAYPATLDRVAPLAERLRAPSGPMPGAAALVRELVTLPTHSRVSQAELRAVARLVEEVARRGAEPIAARATPLATSLANSTAAS